MWARILHIPLYLPNVLTGIQIREAFERNRDETDPDRIEEMKQKYETVALHVIDVVSLVHTFSPD